MSTAVIASTKSPLAELEIDDADRENRLELLEQSVFQILEEAGST